LRAGIFLPDAVGRQAVVAAAGDLLGRVAAQDADEVLGAEALAGAQHGGEGLAGGVGGVEEHGTVGAEVAVAAGLGHLLGEIGEQGLAAAALGLGEAHERVQALVLGLLALDRRGALVDLGAAQADVVGAVEGERVGGGAVAPGPADLLVIGLDGLRQVGMGDEADVGLVDAHAEGDRGADHQPVLALEAFLGPAALVGLEAGVVGHRGVAGLGQRLGQRLGPGAGGAVDDAGAAAAAVDEIHQLLARAVLGLEGEAQVRAVEAAQEGARLGAAEEPCGDLGAGLGIGGRGERDGLDAVEEAPQLADAQVVGAEVVAPLADAMRLVDGEQADADPAQQAAGAGGGEALGRHVEELQLAPAEGRHHRVGLFRAVAGGERAGGDAGLGQGPDLVAHQRDQGRDHHGHALAAERGQLEAERLAATGRHDGEHVLACGDGCDDLGLAGAELGIAEDLGEQRLGGHSGSGSRRRIEIMVSP
jgi:hypothetical protein